MCICQFQQCRHPYCFLAISPTPNTYLYLLVLLLVEKEKKTISFRLRDEAYMRTQLRREETLVVLALLSPGIWYTCKAYLSGSCL